MVLNPPTGENSELIIGLITAVGTETPQVISLIEERLKLAGYNVVKIKISESIIEKIIEVNYSESDQYDRINKLMDAGNEIRRKSTDPAKGEKGYDGVLADGVASAIYEFRSNARRERSGDSETDGAPKNLPRTAFIVDSLKRPEEINRLRSIYPNGFLTVAIQAEEERRLEHLIRNRGISEEKAKLLIKRDGEEERIEHGQRVNKTFHLADVFVRITENRDRLRCDIQRMVEIWFGFPFHTPTFDEFAMFMAFASSLRSSDLSRQVGAVIAKGDSIASTGANDVPKFGGGLYWPVRDDGVGLSDYAFGRDYKLGCDQNQVEKINIVEKIAKRLLESGYEDENKLKEILLNSPVKDITEYGRVVHAEMEALIACARIGVSPVGSTLYSTTFPCHNCAKHIVAAGIVRVVYVEPYPKSKALDFHKDSISLFGGDNHKKVVFEPFEGIGARRYHDLFSMNGGVSYPIIRKDKKSGRISAWKIEEANLRLKLFPQSYIELEEESAGCFLDAIKEIKHEK